MSQSNMVHFPDTPSALPEDLANEFTTKTEFRSAESVLSGKK